MQADLDRLCAGRTTLIVAHHLATLCHVDRVLVFADGRIVEDGPPDELRRRASGAFARLNELQQTAPAPGTTPD